LTGSSPELSEKDGNTSAPLIIFGTALLKMPAILILKKPVLDSILTSKLL
jgi:hypothetical protein